MKKYFCFFFGCFLPFVWFHIAFSQAHVKTWDKIYGGNAYESFSRVLQTKDHGLVVAGSSNSGAGGDKTQDNHDTSMISFDFWIIRTDSAGTLLWEKSFGGNKHEELIDIKETTDNGFILAGITLSDTNGDVSQVTRGSKDYWILKTDSSGNKLWEKRFGGNQTELLSCITQTKDGGFLLGGSSLSNLSGDKTANNHNPNNLNFDYWIVKTDSLGNKLWDKTIGGDNYDLMQDVLQVPSGGFLLGGYSKSEISGDKTGSCRTEADFWIVKINDSGKIIWDKTFGGDNIDWLFGMSLCHDGGFILAGTSGSSGSIGERTAPSRGGWDYWVVKTDATGNKLWDRAYGGSADEEVYHIIQTQDNGFLISGTSYSNMSGEKTEDNFGKEQGWLVKTDSAGIFDWDITIFTYGHDESGYAIQTHEGCYVAGVNTESDTGGYKSLHNFAATDYWFVKFCYEGPTASFFSSDTVLCNLQCVDFFDSSTNNPVSWNWSFPGATPATSQNQHPTNICYMSPGNFPVSLTVSNAYATDSITKTGFIQVAVPSIPVVNVHGDTLFCSPAFSYQWFLDTIAIPGATSSFYVMTAPGSYSVVVTDSLGCSGKSEIITTGLQQYAALNSLSVIPNPSTGKFTMLLNSFQDKPLTVSVQNVQGEVVFQSRYFMQRGLMKIHIDLGPIPEGIYFLNTDNFNNFLPCKLLITR